MRIAVLLGDSILVDVGLHIGLLEYGSRYASMHNARVLVFHLLFWTRHSGCILVANGLYK